MSWSRPLGHPFSWNIFRVLCRILNGEFWEVKLEIWGSIQKLDSFRCLGFQNGGAYVWVRRASAPGRWRSLKTLQNISQWIQIFRRKFQISSNILHCPEDSVQVLSKSNRKLKIRGKFGVPGRDSLNSFTISKIQRRKLVTLTFNRIARKYS